MYNVAAFSWTNQNFFFNFNALYRPNGTSYKLKWAYFWKVHSLNNLFFSMTFWRSSLNNRVIKGQSKGCQKYVFEIWHGKNTKTSTISNKKKLIIVLLQLVTHMLFVRLALTVYGPPFCPLLSVVFPIPLAHCHSGSHFSDNNCHSLTVTKKFRVVMVQIFSSLSPSNGQTVQLSNWWGHIFGNLKVWTIFCFLRLFDVVR